MERIFVTVVNMSIAASWVITAILLVRLILRRAPKKYSYVLWAAAGFRLCCPVSFKLPGNICRSVCRTACRCRSAELCQRNGTDMAYVDVDIHCSGHRVIYQIETQNGYCLQT